MTKKIRRNQEEYDSYPDLYDEIDDKGQYYMPQMTIKPEAYWNCITLMYEADRNDLNREMTVRDYKPTIAISHWQE
ncbi:hypothetical protein NXY00_15545 [Bacteroides sp. BFG-551]|nr:hypothetical protein [Bacteroides sp. BFG-551]